jgi:hypothetical protein
VGEPPLPVSPIHGATILNNRPSFVWSPAEGAVEYRIQVYRGESVRKASLVWSEAANEERLAYPKGEQALQNGDTYTWKVSDHKGGVVAQGTFTIASEEEGRILKPLIKLSESVETSDRLLAAMLLEQDKVYDESHRLFEGLTRELPGEPWILLSSARHLSRLGRIDEAAQLEKKVKSLTKN